MHKSFWSALCCPSNCYSDSFLDSCSSSIYKSSNHLYVHLEHCTFHHPLHKSCILV